MIHRNIDLERRLIDDLLDMARITRGRLTLNLEPVDMNALLRQVQQICAYDIGAKNLQVTIEGGGAGCWMRGDPFRLQQVLWNLLRNAIKFTPPGGKITLRCTSDGKKNIVMQVDDSGIGIEPDLLTSIFSSFREPGAARPSGLGLGLTISRGLVEAHGGTIKASSDGRGRGARFTVTLPASEGAPSKKTPTSLPASDAIAPARILLIEDHRDTAAALLRLLQRRKHQVQVAHDIHSALRLARAQEFDLIISDLSLPDGNALDMMRQLSGKGRTLPPAIALTGHGAEADVQSTQEAGFAKHLTKPINITDLESAIAQVMQKDRSTHSS
jgi:CheY-like chemotaxis protein